MWKAVPLKIAKLRLTLQAMFRDLFCDIFFSHTAFDNTIHIVMEICVRYMDLREGSEQVMASWYLLSFGNKHSLVYADP